MVLITEFPLELVFYIFTCLDLKSVIAAYAVCREWRKLIPASNISPPRRALFDLFLKIVSSPYFPGTRPWALKKLVHFDREAYLAALLTQHNYVPEDFRLWILEWPARAAFGCIWPGLPCINITDDMADGVQLIEGVNWLGYLPPKVCTMTWHNNGKRIPVPALLIWGCYPYTWLVLDKREELRSKVIELEGGCKIRTLKDGIDRVHMNWIEFLHKLWGWIEEGAAALSRNPKKGKKRFSGGGSTKLPKFPGTPWVVPKS